VSADGWEQIPAVPPLHVSIVPMRLSATSPPDGERRNHLAYGYLRAEEQDEIEIALLRKDMARFCRDCDYGLVNVAVDRGSDGTELARPGFAAALAALEEPGVSALVLPTVTHLSDDPLVRQGLLRTVARTGVDVLTVYRDTKDRRKR
jgi:hypothetical protein